MCDTLYKKLDTGFLFGKNSDRSANEPNLTIFFPRKENTEKTLKCTYIEIEQVPLTYATLLIKPSWMWGAEMGVNEHKVVIGNEAVFTKSKGKKTERLIGMDFVRLALERSQSAQEALNCIIQLLETYGQGGNCGFDKKFYYDNSYLICDAFDAYILETSGKKWAVKVLNSSGSISNRLTIHKDYTNTSVEQNADFFASNSEPIYTHFSGSACRLEKTIQSLNQDHFNDYRDVIHLLQSHYPKDDKTLLQKGSLKSVCMHQSLLGDHTTSSMIVEYIHNELFIYLTSSSTPCISLYKPVFFGIIESVVFDNEESAYNYWMKEEKITRYLLQDHSKYVKYKKDIIATQEKIDLLINPARKKTLSLADKQKLMKSAFKIEVDFDKAQKVLPDRDQNHKILKIWEKRNYSLGKNCFKRTLAERIQND